MTQAEKDKIIQKYLKDRRRRITQKQKYVEGQIVSQEIRGWKRKITKVIKNYMNEKGRIGYEYLAEDCRGLEFKYPGMCSQSHLDQWKQR